MLLRTGTKNKQNMETAILQDSENLVMFRHIDLAIVPCSGRHLWDPG